MFQSTHPRRVRLISDSEGLKRVMFQSTHPRRVRQAEHGKSDNAQCFNPRTHVGCDCAVWLFCIVLKSFNPRTHVGCDEGGLRPEPCQREFQSTHPRRVRQLAFGVVMSEFSFNPRTHVGCDPERLLPFPWEKEFQSTHPRRVRPQQRPPVSVLHPCFNPRTHVGCDSGLPVTGARRPGFQSTHPRRVRHN